MCEPEVNKERCVKLLREYVLWKKIIDTGDE